VSADAAMRILIVDDDEVDRLAIRRALRGSAIDLTVEEASAAPEALKAACSQTFDCILLDYYLPGCDGFDLLRKIREECPRTPVVMLTGHGDEHTAVELMKAGATDYIAKNGLSGDRLVQSLRYATERQRLENERDALLVREQHARQEAERANRAKDHFLAVLSHDLRTPLTAILGWTRMLRAERPDAASIGRGLEIIERNAQAQTRLIEDLVDVSRITSGKFQLAVRSVEPATICANAVEAVRPAAEEKNVRLEEILDVAVGPIVADPSRLQQVVWNLLTNAIKFTPPGGTVRLELHPSDAGVEVTVADTGRGIRPEFLPRVFEPFSQAAESVQGGLGLGLTIVYSIVEMHGGTVRAASDGEGKGATFRVTLPLSGGAKRDGREPEQLKVRAPGLAESPNLQGVNVLFVDDNADARELIRMIFVARGAAVRTYSTVDEALAALERERPDVIISDIEMPGGDGYELIRALRVREDPDSRIPAIALTGFVSVEDRIRVLTSGFQLHVPKPVEPAELVTAVATLVTRRSRPF
jgi:signal transduction histidine kinase